MNQIIASKPLSIHWQSEPVCTIVPDAANDRLLLMEDFHFEVKTKTKTHSFTVLAGFRFEGSVPRLFWRFITPTDPAAWAGFCVHDWMYQLCRAKLLKREFADECLYLALFGRFPRLTVSGVYYAVRLGGSSHVKKSLTVEEEFEIRNML